VETHLLAVGKLRPGYRAMCDDYLRRLRRYGRLVEREVREAQGAGSPALRRREESARLLDAAPERALLVALDRGGSAWTSEELAHRLERWRAGGRPLALLIGGAFGLDPELVRNAAARWSLGPLTLPHELARVVVAEQWYRAWTILRGEPYHKGGAT
jgi:23S rRNA (pseudouridine1915-N3)-methyltransferase